MKVNVTELYVVVGAHKLNSKESSQQRKAVIRTIVHGRFNEGPEDLNDVALIELESPVKLNKRVINACLPKK